MDIKLLKTRLNELGFGPLTVTDPNYGPKTINAVKKFQQSVGFTGNDVDGKVGPKTIKKLWPGEKSVDKPDPNVKIEEGDSTDTLPIRAMKIAVSQNRVKEKTGKNDGPEVEMYLRSIGLGKGYSWCMAFVYWCYQQASSQLKVSNPLFRTGGVLKQWNETPTKDRVIKDPQPGDIFIMDLGKGNGHTGIVMGYQDSKGTFLTVEGNTNTNGSANGDGVYLRSRKISQVKGFIRVS